MTTRCFLNGLAGVPGAVSTPQGELAERLRVRLGDLPGSEPIRRMVGFVYEHSAIGARLAEAPPEDGEGSEDWQRRVNEATVSMGRRALGKLFSGARDPSRCDGFVAVTSTHVGFPSLTRRLQQQAGISPDAVAYDLSGLGCAGPTQGIALAQMLIETGACNDVCLLCVDAMGTMEAARRFDRVPSLSEVVAHCLASDGAAALVVSRTPDEDTRLSFRGATLSSRLWRDALDQNDLGACDAGQPYLSVGKEIRTRILGELAPFVAEARGEPAIFHPGGAALVRSLTQAYPELSETLALSSGVLADHGNIGSASLLWVLDRALESDLEMSPTLRLFALGPGIVSTVLRLDAVERGR